MLESVTDNRIPLAERAAGKISAYIIENRLEAGSRLPNELELSRILNVGRSTVREAVRFLVSRNVVNIVRGCGTIVTSHPGVAADPLGFEFVRDKEKLLEDLLEIRSIIEPAIAGLAARRASEPDIERLERLVGAIDRRMEQRQAFAEADIELHQSIAESTRNEVISLLNPIINKSIYLTTELLTLSENQPAEHPGQPRGDRFYRETGDTHREIVRAIREHDVAGAETAMLRHIQNNKQLIELALPAHGRQPAAAASAAEAQVQS